MLELKSIERFLSSNSSVNPQSIMDEVVQANLKTKYRPDKLFPRDGFMKWDMIFNGIDTPHRMANRATMAVVNRVWISTEMNDLKDFKI